MKAAAASSTFERAYPSYEATRALDELRAREYPALAALGCTYLDYTAANLYATSQLERHFSLLRDHVFGNPHSTNPTSSFSTSSIARVRQRVLAFFNASPDEWAVIFTANASQALKLVGESYPFGPDGRYLLTFDNHNSVNGIREFARAEGRDRDLHSRRAAGDAGRRTRSRRASSIASTGRRPSLFAYPAQSNFSGVQHPLEWIDARAGARLGRAARRRRVHADQPARSRPMDAGLRRAVLLQDLRVPDRRRLSARAQAGAGQAAASLVCGRHHHGGVGAGRQALSGRRRIGLRGRHAGLSGAARGRNRSASTSTRSAWT